MIRFALFSFLVLFFMGLAYGQAPEKRFVGNCSFSGFALVSDSTYRGNITRFDDRMGDGYNLTQLATGYEIFDGRGLVFSIGTIHSSTNFTADVTVTAKVDRGFEPFGSGQVYRPTAAGLIPPSSQEQAGLSPTQKARIDRHNVVTMQSLIGDRDTVYSITNVSDTSTLSPQIGYIFVNSTADTMGIYGDDGWVLFFGGGGSVDTTLIATRNYADSLFNAADSLRQLGDKSTPVLIQAFDRSTQLNNCATSRTVSTGFYLLDNEAIDEGSITFEVNTSPAPITYDIYNADSTAYYFEVTASRTAGTYFWEVSYTDGDGNSVSDLNSFDVVAGRPDTVTVPDPPGQDSILVTRVCGTEVSRDTIDIQHPFSTVSAELEIDAGELKLAQQGASADDALRWNGSSYVPSPINAIEVIDTLVQYTICKDTCDFTTFNQAFDFVSARQITYDSTGIASVVLKVVTNGDGTPMNFTENTLIKGGNYSLVTVTSDTADHTFSGSTYFLGFSNCVPPKVRYLNVTAANANTFGLFYNNIPFATVSNVNIDSFRLALYCINATNLRVSKSRLWNGRGSNATNVWLESTSAYFSDCNFSNADAGLFRMIRNSAMQSFRDTFLLGVGQTKIFRGLDGFINLQSDTIDGGFINRTNTTEINQALMFIASGVGVQDFGMGVMNPDGLMLTDQTDEAFFMEADSIATKPNGALVRYYTNMDDAAGEGGLMISDGDTTYYSIPSVSATPDDGDVIAYNATTGRYDPVAPSGGGISGLTTNTIPVATSATTIGDSWLSQSGSILSMASGKLLNFGVHTTGGRPTGAAGLTGYNSTLGVGEMYYNAKWNQFVGTTLAAGKFTSGAIPIADTDGNLTQDIVNLGWDFTFSRLGIGITSGMAAKLHVTQPINSSAGLGYFDNPQSTTTFTDTYGSLIAANSNTTNNNFVRINFSDEAGPASSAMAARIINHTLNYADYLFYTRAADGFLERMTILSAGNVGIGESAPDAKLEVVGDAIITSTLYLNAAKTVGIFSGTGSPESAVTASVGSTYHRTDGGAGTTFYVKESGTGNTGWVAK